MIICGNSQHWRRKLMKKAISKYKFVISTMLLLVFSMLSYQAHAGGVKVIIVDSDYGNDNTYLRHKNYYRQSNSDRLHNYNRSNRHYIGYGNHGYGKKYYRNNYYGYGNNRRYDNRRSYQKRGSYYPY